MRGPVENGRTRVRGNVRRGSDPQSGRRFEEVMVRARVGGSQGGEGRSRAGPTDHDKGFWVHDR